MSFKSFKSITTCVTASYMGMFYRHESKIVHVFLLHATKLWWLYRIASCIFKVALVQYIPRNMYTVFALLCFVVVIHWLIFPYPSGLLHWHCGNLTIAPVPAKQPWWIWTKTSCEFIMNDCIATTKQSTTKPCAYFMGYTVVGNVFQRVSAPVVSYVRPELLIYRRKVHKYKNTTCWVWI